MSIKKGHCQVLRVVTLFLLLNSSYGRAEGPSARIQDVLATPTYCINLLSLGELPHYAPPPPNKIIQSYRERRALYSESMTPLQSIWHYRQGKQNALFLKVSDDRKLDIDDYRRLEALQELSFAAIHARRDSQEALLEFFSAADGDLAKIARVAERYEKRLNEKNRGNVLTAFDLAGREFDATENAAEKLAQWEARRNQYLEAKKNIETFVGSHPALAPWVSEGIAHGVPTLELVQESIAQQVRQLMTDENKSYAEAIHLKIGEFDRAEMVWQEYKNQVDKRRTSAASSEEWIASNGNKNQSVISAWKETKVAYDRAYYFAQAQAFYAELSASVLHRLETEASPSFQALSDDEKAFTIRKFTTDAEDLLTRVSQATQWELAPPTPQWYSHKDGFTGRFDF